MHIQLINKLTLSKVKEKDILEAKYLKKFYKINKNNNVIC